MGRNLAAMVMCQGSPRDGSSTMPLPQMGMPLPQVGRQPLVGAEGDPRGLKEKLEDGGVECIPCDLLDRAALERLPRAKNIVFMAGHKFGAVGNPAFTWAMNAGVPLMAAEAFRVAGPIRGLVNCAGIYPVTPLLEMAVEEWDRVLNTNLKGPFLVTQAVARRMIEARSGGSIVNISSSASRLARPGIAHYAASKAGLNQLTAVMAVELAPHGIRVNAVAPGLIGTDRVLAAARGPAGEAEHTTKLARIPLGREGTPAEVGDLVLFLLSPEASYCTGGVYAVDGGFTLGIPRY